MCEKSTRYARGTVWWVDTVDDSMCSTSQKGRRPFLIISKDEFNIKFDKVTVIPMSQQDKYEKYHFTVPTYIQDKKVFALVDQIRQMDVHYLQNYAYTINNNVLKTVDSLIVQLYTGYNVTPIKTNSVIESAISSKDNKDVLASTKETDVVKNNSKGITKNMPITNEIKPIKREKSHPRTFKGKDSSAMPHGFYTLVDNNINWWNDFLNYGTEYVKTKYNLKDYITFSKRKYLVKKFLLQHNYDLTKIINRKE